MPQMVEILGLSKAVADERVQEFGLDGVPVEVIPQDDGTFTVRATYPDDMEIPGAIPLPAPDAPLPQPPGPPPPAQDTGALHLGTKGAALVKAFESCLQPVGGGKFRAYSDPVHVLTIAWGHTNHNGRQFDASAVWTQAECDSEFLADMAIFEKAVTRNVTVKLNQDQFDALVSFTFNLGEGNLKQSTLLKKINASDFAGAALEFPRWNKAGGQVLPGLVRRRASEALLFQSIPDSNYDGVPD
jgi:lysozyme